MFDALLKMDILLCIYAVDETSKFLKLTQFGGLGNVVVLLRATYPPTIFFVGVNCQRIQR